MSNPHTWTKNVNPWQINPAIDYHEEDVMEDLILKLSMHIVKISGILPVGSTLIVSVGKQCYYNVSAHPELTIFENLTAAVKGVASAVTVEEI